MSLFANRWAQVMRSSPDLPTQSHRFAAMPSFLFLGREHHSPTGRVRGISGPVTLNLPTYFSA